MPYATAEIGGGCQITDRRRPIVAGKDIGALLLSKIGSGVRLSILDHWMNPLKVIKTAQ